MKSAFDREYEHLEEMLEDGEMTLKEFNKAIAELERDAREEAREAAQEAYDQEIDRW